jgi:hypothetical protein
MRYILSIVLVGFLFTSCTQKDTGACGDVVCTADFAMINVVLQDSVGNAYIPDKVETYNISSGALLNQSTTPSIANTNYYTVVDDNNKQAIPMFAFTTVEFRVTKNNMVVKRDSFIMSSNCCHVFKQAGTDTVVVK